MNRFVFFKPLGRGTFGIVYKGFDCVTGTDVAIKQIAKNTENVSKEVEILEKLKGSKNCVKVLSVFYGFTRQLCEFIVFEYLPYTLKEFIYREKRDDEAFRESLRFVFREIIRGLKDLHDLGIVHRDLKPENILVDDFVNPKVVKICDFGSAKYSCESCWNPYVVSSFYRAPELLFAAQEYSSAIDIWAAGCILVEMYIKRPLFYCCFEGELFSLQVKELGKPCDEVLRYFALEAGVVFEELWRAVQILDKKFGNVHKAVRINKDGMNRSVYKIVKKLLKWDHKERPSASTILSYKFLQ